MTPDFSPVARLYRYLEYGSFGPLLWWCRTTFLKEIQQARRVLMVGEGDGRFLAEFLHRNPEARVDYLDASPAMADLARERAAGNPRVTIRTGALPGHALPAATYDLISTHFFLDCFTAAELPAVVDALARAATPGALWVVSEFRIPPNPLLALAGQALTRALYLFFGLTTGLGARRLPSHAPLLTTAGFRVLYQRHRLAGVLTSELWTR